MKTLIQFVSVVLFVSGLLVQPARAQERTKSSIDQQSEFRALIAQEAWSKFLTEGVIPTALSGMQLDTFTKAQWNELCKKQLKAIQSDDPEARDVAMQNIVYLAEFYKDNVHFRKACCPLLNIYMFSRDDQQRIMALAGMHAIGDPDVMATLCQRVKLEGSPRVRKLTIAALADFYGVRDYYDRPVEKTTPRDEQPDREIATTRQ